MNRATLAAAALVATASALPAFAAWEPTKPVEFVVPAGTGLSLYQPAGAPRRK